MKIDASPEIQGSDYAVKKNTDPQNTGVDFSAILKESLENTSGAGGVSLQGEQISGISKSQFELYNSVEEPTVDQIENYLNMLAEYQEKLGNPEVTLKELSPLVDQMIQENERLSSTLESLPENDGLKEILSETLVLSSLETIKFNRGDYNPE